MRLAQRAVMLALVIGIGAPAGPAGAQVIPRPASVTIPRSAAARSRPAVTPHRYRGGQAPRSATRRVVGALVGAAFGGAMGWAIGSAACDRCDDPAPIVTFAGLGAAAGSVVGALVGIPPVQHATRSAGRLRVAQPARLRPIEMPQPASTLR